MAAGRRWTRDELLVALNLYHKLTFGQLHARQPAIVALAEKLERGSNSVAMKLCNFASLDPALKLRGIKGLEGASTLDRTVWSEFHADLNETVPASEDALRKLFGVDESGELEVTERRCPRPEAAIDWPNGDDCECKATPRAGLFPRRCAEQLWRALRRHSTGSARVADCLAHPSVGLARFRASECSQRPFAFTPSRCGL